MVNWPNGLEDVRCAMPRGPNGEKRLADTNACAVHVLKMATSVIEGDMPRDFPDRREGQEREGDIRAGGIHNGDLRQTVTARASVPGR